MGPATTAQQIAAALATAVDSGEFTTSLQLAGQAGLCVRLWPHPLFAGLRKHRRVCFCSCISMLSTQHPNTREDEKELEGRHSHQGIPTSSLMKWTDAGLDTTGVSLGALPPAVPPVPVVSFFSCR